MAESAFVISITPTSGEGDVKYWVELGAAVMKDKPLLVVVLPGTVLPKKLIAIADEIVYLPEGINPTGSTKLMEAINRISEKLGT